MLNTVSCTLLALSLEREATVFQFWLEQTMSRGMLTVLAALERKGQGDGTALSLFSLSEMLHLFLVTHKILGEAFSGIWEAIMQK